MDRRSHWEKVWTGNVETEFSWFQQHPETSLSLIERHVGSFDERILDVGGGSSRLVDGLLERGCRHVGVLDIAEPALEMARARLDDRAGLVEWVAADILHYSPAHQWDIWHDRAVFHFLLDPSDRDRYVETVRKTLAPSAHMVVATFGPEGPIRCSGLDVMRHSPNSLSEAFSPDFELVDNQTEIHRTPAQKDQQFLYCVFQRKAANQSSDNDGRPE